MAAQKEMIRIRLKAYDHQVIDQSAEKIVETAKRTGATRSPAPSPAHQAKRLSPFCALSISIRTAASSLSAAPTSASLTSPSSTPKTVEALMALELPAGVEIEIKL
jgi:small subunit ribosomal protein S10